MGSCGSAFDMQVNLRHWRPDLSSGLPFTSSENIVCTELVHVKQVPANSWLASELCLTNHGAQYVSAAQAGSRRLVWHNVDVYHCIFDVLKLLKEGSEVT